MGESVVMAKTSNGGERAVDVEAGREKEESAGMAGGKKEKEGAWWRRCYRPRRQERERASGSGWAEIFDGGYSTMCGMGKGDGVRAQPNLLSESVIRDGNCGFHTVLGQWTPHGITHQSRRRILLRFN